MTVNFVPLPSEDSTPTVKSKNDKEESMDLMTEMFEPSENELRPTQVYHSWAEATVPFEMIEIRDFIKRRPFDQRQVAQEMYDVMMFGNFEVCKSLEEKTGIHAWNMLKVAKGMFTDLVYNNKGETSEDAIIVEDSD